MRKPLNQNEFRTSPRLPAAQPMLKRRRKFRYDPAPASDPSWSESSTDCESDLQEYDMDVTGPGAIGAAAPIRPTQLAPTSGIDAPLAGDIVAPQDEVQISSAARALGGIDAGSQLHEARLAEIRAAIADGAYDTPERLEAAVERLVAALRNGDA